MLSFKGFLHVLFPPTNTNSLLCRRWCLGRALGWTQKTTGPELWEPPFDVLTPHHWDRPTPSSVTHAVLWPPQSQSCALESISPPFPQKPHTIIIFAFFIFNFFFLAAYLSAMKTAQVSSILREGGRKEGNKSWTELFGRREKAGDRRREAGRKEPSWAYSPFLAFLKKYVSLTIIKTWQRKKYTSRPWDRQRRCALSPRPRKLMQSCVPQHLPWAVLSWSQKLDDRSLAIINNS